MSQRDELAQTLTDVLPGPRKQTQAELHITAGDDAGKRHLFERPVRIGSGPLADVVLRDPRISTLHLEVSLDVEGGLRLKDLGSKNGTLVGKVRIHEAVVPLDSEVTLGRTRISFRRTGATVDVPLFPRTEFHGLIGRSDAMRALIAQVDRLARSDSAVLIEGETGSGKERVAEAIHLAGPRANEPFEVVDCGAVAPGLFESYFFGHAAGAFSGAETAHKGALERAGSGTLFLDEIGELPMPLQPKLLGALERREFTVVGGDAPIRFNARVVAATHRDLAMEVSRGRFRQDLFFRIAAVRLRVPPLRERKDDLALLAFHFLEEDGLEPMKFLTDDSLRRLEDHDWPGNVRELRNTIERAITLAEPPRPVQASLRDLSATAVDLSEPLPAGKQRVIEAYERAYLVKLFEASKGNIALMARKAGMDRVSLYRMMRRLKFDPKLQSWPE